jgi:hypothetical protein
LLSAPFPRAGARWLVRPRADPVGDSEHVKVFVDEDAANEWFKANDPEGVAFEYPVIGELFDRMIRRPTP